MKSITARNEVASDFFRLTFVSETYRWRRPRRSIEIMQTYIFSLENCRKARCQSNIEKIAQHLLLWIDRYTAPAGQLFEIDTMAAPVKQ